MPFQPVPDTAEALVLMQQNGQPLTMTFHYLKVGGYDQEDIDALAAAVDVFAEAEIQPLLSTSSLYRGVEVRGLESTVDLFAAVTNVGAGAIASNPLPNQNALAVKRVTGFTGRSARGRVFFPLCVAYLGTNEDEVDATSAETVRSSIEEAIDAAIGDGWIHVLVSRQQDGVVPDEAVTRTITEYQLSDLVIDSQRRRMPGR